MTVDCSQRTQGEARCGKDNQIDCRNSSPFRSGAAGSNIRADRMLYGTRPAWSQCQRSEADEKVRADDEESGQDDETSEERSQPRAEGRSAIKVTHRNRRPACEARPVGKEKRYGRSDREGGGQQRERLRSDAREREVRAAR